MEASAEQRRRELKSVQLLLRLVLSIAPDLLPRLAAPGQPYLAPPKAPCAVARSQSGDYRTSRYSKYDESPNRGAQAHPDVSGLVLWPKERYGTLRHHTRQRGCSYPA